MTNKGDMKQSDKEKKMKRIAYKTDQNHPAIKAYVKAIENGMSTVQIALDQAYDKGKREGAEEVIEKIMEQEFMEYLGDVPTQYLSAESNASIKSHDEFVDTLSSFLSQFKEEGESS